MIKQYYNTNNLSNVQECPVEESSRGKHPLAIRLNDGEVMYVNVDADGWVEIRFSDNMKKVIKANADYFASYYR